MGHSWSSRRRHDHPHHQNSPPPEPLPSSSSSSLNPPATLPPPQSSPSSSPPPQPLLPTPPPPPPPPPRYAFAANAPHITPQNPPQTPYPPLPLPLPRPSLLPYPHHPNAYNYARPMVGQSYYHPNQSNQSNGWAPFHPPAPAPLQPPPYVDHQSTKKIKNDVNVHKDTIRVEVDEQNKDCYLVSFTFDAMVDGSITIFYFAKEGTNCTFTPLYPEIHMPVRIPFQKGLGQKFYQPLGTGGDLGFFDIDDLSKPLPGDVFPLVISAESCLPCLPTDEQLDEPLLTSPHAQISQAVLEKNNEGHLQVRVVKQILWVDEVRYELRELYGISNSDETTTNDNDSGKECVICMTDPKDTAILPCRHMCLCSECAKALRLQSDKCPICRQPIEEILEIKVDEAMS